MIKYPLTRPYFDEQEISEIRRVLESGWVSQGPEVKKFEERVAEFLGVRYAIAVANCTCALHLANLGIGLEPGDEVLVADYTFPATGHSVVYCRAKPVFVDIDPKTYNIDPEMIRSKITRKTKAIIPVHTFGQPADMDPIMEIAGDCDLAVIEDAACALGSSYKGRSAGSIGDVGCISFHARKGITTGEGGMVVTNNSEIAEKIRYLSVFGMRTAWEREITGSFTIPQFHDIGYNYKMSDISAAVGLVQMGKLDRIIQKKQDLAKCWDEHLDRIDLIVKPYRSEDCFHVYQSYIAKVDPKVNRNRVIERLALEGVQTQIGTYASHIQPAYGCTDSCPVSLDVYNRAIAFPLYYSLDYEGISEICGIINRVLTDAS